MNIEMMPDTDLLALVLGNKSEAKKLSGTPLVELFGFDNHYDSETFHGVHEPENSYKVSGKLKAIHELWVRCMASRLSEYHLCDNAKEIGQFLCTKFAGKKHEVMACLFLDNSHKIIRFEEVSSGTINASAVYCRPIAQRALQLNAAAVALVHNHISAHALTPSAADISVTKHVRDGLKILDIRLLDHFIVCGNQYISFVEKGFI